MDTNFSAQYLTAYVNHHYFGFPIQRIQDVIGPQDMTKVPLANPAIAGVLNLRGRIVTAVYMSRRFKEPDSPAAKASMGIILESSDELFSLIVDHVEDVMTIHDHQIEKAPPTLDPVWYSVCMGVCQMNGKILIILDPQKILDLNLD